MGSGIWPNALWLFFVLTGALTVVSLCKTAVVRAVSRRSVPGAGGPLLCRGDCELLVWGIFALAFGVARLVPVVSGLAMVVAVFFGYAWVSMYGVSRPQAGRESKLLALAMLAIPPLLALLVGVGNFLGGNPTTGLISLALGASALILLGFEAGLGQRLIQRVAR